MEDKYKRDPNLLDFKTEKVRDVFPKEEKPWTKCKLKRHTTSAESHLLYKLAKDGGPGNYADVGCLFGGSTSSFGHGLEAGGHTGTIYAVDYFGTGPENDPGVLAAPVAIEKYFLDTFKKATVKICIGTSVDWSQKLDIKFNGVFIDADHCYEHCSQDIAAWGPKIEKGGFMCFHDTNFLGVDKAIKELDPKIWRFEQHIFSIKVFRRL